MSGIETAALEEADVATRVIELARQLFAGELYHFDE